MKLHIFAAVCLLIATLAGCTATVQGTMNNPAAASGERIGEEKATAIALEQAGLEKTDVTRLRTEYEVDNGTEQYDVEFHHSGYEYEYEIDAHSGAVISADRDSED